MYSMTAAHPTLPIPSYVRVTNLATGKSVVLRVNDRGPFIDNRLIDLSYTAAYRIGVLSGGSALVEVESIIPDGAVIAKASPTAPASRETPEHVRCRLQPGAESTREAGNTRVRIPARRRPDPRDRGSSGRRDIPI